MLLLPFNHFPSPQEQNCSDLEAEVASLKDEKEKRDEKVTALTQKASETEEKVKELEAELEKAKSSASERETQHKSQMDEVGGLVCSSILFPSTPVGTICCVW